MKHKITTVVALLAVTFALTGVASAFDVKFLLPDGTLTNPVFMRNGENFNLDLQIGLLRVQDINITSDIFLVYTGCANETGEFGVNCDASDINAILLKDNITATSIPTTLQPDTVEVTMTAPPGRKPGTQYSFLVSVNGPFGQPPESASVSLTVVLAGANITGMKFNDLNGDGIKGTTEPGLPGWKIILKENGTEIANTTTGPNGEYNFSNLRGNFTVEEVLQSGWNQTFPANKTYNVTVDALDVPNLDFGNVAIAGISGMKFNDLNHDGVNNGEPGLQGWTIILKNKDTGATATTTTDASGNYNFSNLLPGNYTVDELQQGGWVQSAPIPVPPGNYSVTLAGADVTGRDFGNYQPLANISGMKFNDLNHNGVNNAEPGLQGWTIILKNNTGATVATTTTDSSGNYNFSNLLPGNYTVDEVQQGGWVQSAPIPVPPGNYSVTLAGADVTGRDFGNYQPLANISGMKFNDLNHNGVNNAEPGLQGWTIILKNKDTGATVATTTTDPSGNYNFSNLLPGNYSVDEVQQGGWVQSAPTPVPPGNYSVTLAGTDVTGRDFGNYQPPQLANISGMKFNDSNNNGVNDGEQGLAGWTITLSGPVSATTTTDASGKYNFTGLLPGTYTVSETQQGGWTQTAPKPVPPGTHTVVLNGVDVTGKDFGNFKIPPPQQVPGKAIGWGILGSKGSFTMWIYSNFLPNGKMEFTDTINNIVIKATRIDSVMTDITAVPKTGTITGMATVNGAGPYAFTVKVVDAADPGAGKDTFTIDVSSPTPYHNSGTLTAGDITVVK